MGLGSSSEDVDAVAVDAGGDIYLSSEGNFGVNGTSGADEDVFICRNPLPGPSTSCGSWQMFFDGSPFGLGTNDILGIDLP